MQGAQLTLPPTRGPSASPAEKINSSLESVVEHTCRWVLPWGLGAGGTHPQPAHVGVGRVATPLRRGTWIHPGQSEHDTTLSQVAGSEVGMRRGEWLPVAGEPPSENAAAARHPVWAQAVPRAGTYS